MIQIVITFKFLSHKVSRNCNISKDIIHDNVITECNNDLNNSVSENFRPFKCLIKRHVRSTIITATWANSKTKCRENNDEKKRSNSILKHIELWKLADRTKYKYKLDF